MNAVWIVVLAIAAIAVIIGVSVRIGSRQNREMDDDPSATAVKHPILANRVFLVYIVGIVLVFAGAMIWGLFRV
ncbi:hypothetical protein [Paenibacillus sp. GCM10027626]|uniref:hypothetical protein n=1 Tax=Paenibacillus sp. GCM10027626 TaxID=3273411 RepID=UPI0036312DE2